MLRGRKRNMITTFILKAIYNLICLLIVHFWSSDFRFSAVSPPASLCTASKLLVNYKLYSSTASMWKRENGKHKGQVEIYLDCDHCSAKHESDFTHSPLAEAALKRVSCSTSEELYCYTRATLPKLIYAEQIFSPLVNEFTAVAVCMQMMLVVDKIEQSFDTTWKFGTQSKKKTFKKSIFSAVQLASLSRLTNYIYRLLCVVSIEWICHQFFNAIANWLCKTGAKSSLPIWMIMTTTPTQAALIVARFWWFIL